MTIPGVSYRDDLVALVESGPLWDGDVPSKSGRDEAITKGFAIRVVYQGQDGYTAATYKGRDEYCRLFDGDTMAKAMANRKAGIQPKTRSTDNARNA